MIIMILKIDKFSYKNGTIRRQLQSKIRRKTILQSLIKRKTLLGSKTRIMNE